MVRYEADLGSEAMRHLLGFVGRFADLGMGLQWPFGDEVGVVWADVGIGRAGMLSIQMICNWFLR